MRWKIAEAKERFSELVREAGQEPQIILNRDRPVAAIVDASTFEQFAAWRRDAERRSVGEMFKEFRRICSEEKYIFKTSARQDRRNALIESLAESPR